MTEVDSSGVQTAILTASASGDTTVIAAEAGQNIHVHKVSLRTASGVDITLKGAANITGTYKIVTAMDFDFEGHLKAGLGNPLIITLGAAVVVGGFISYTKTNTPN